jgi:dihydroorotase
MNRTLIKDATIINEGLKFKGSVLINNDIIEKIFPYVIPGNILSPGVKIIDATGLYLIPGVIDSHVHFREPGLTYKAEIATESKAAVAGGVTSYMEMPNTIPQTTTPELLEQKYQRAAEVSNANYSFYLGATNDNLDNVIQTNPADVCGLKLFMGSSTGNMYVNDESVLVDIFKNSPLLIAAHCEDEQTIRTNLEAAISKYNSEIPPSFHANIRSAEACYRSSSKAVELASRYNARLHVLHLSTAKEMQLFSSGRVKEKNITAEVCIHHLWFDEKDYKIQGNLIKWNPSVKTAKDKEALWEALLQDKIDIISTDHAPHTLEEKSKPYQEAPSGGPMIQHSLTAMLEMSKKNIIPIEKVIQKMCHAPADLFRIDRRGYIREGYFADLVLVSPDENWMVSEKNILSKCGWSPFEGFEFSHKVVSTFVNGLQVFSNGEINPALKGNRLNFDL